MNKKLLYRLHKFAGLIFGFFLLLMGVSGTVITFREELLTKVYPELFHVEVRDSEMQLGEIFEKALYHAKGSITSIYPSEEKSEAWLFLVKREGHKVPTMMTMDPYSGDKVGEMSVGKNIFALMLFIHSNFFLGKAGSFFVGILGVLLSLFIISGLILWVPQHHLAQKFKRTMKLDSHQKWHHAIGVIFAVPLFISALTGFMIVFDFWSPKERESVTQCSMQGQINVLRNLTFEEQSRLISVQLCSVKSGHVKVSMGTKNRHYLDGYERIIFDSLTNAVLQRINSEKDSKTSSFKKLFIFPLHSGELLGLVGKIIVLLEGFALSGLCVTGFRLYLSRRRRRATPSHHASEEDPEPL